MCYGPSLLPASYFFSTDPMLAFPRVPTPRTLYSPGVFGRQPRGDVHLHGGLRLRSRRRGVMLGLRKRPTSVRWVWFLPESLICILHASGMGRKRRGKKIRSCLVNGPALRISHHSGRFTGRNTGMSSGRRNTLKWTRDGAFQKGCARLLNLVHSGVGFFRMHRG